MPTAIEQQLRAQLASLQAREAGLVAKVAELTAQNQQLLQAIDTLSRRLFGKSSERLDPNQLEFVLGQLARPVQPDPPAAPEGLAPAAPANRRKQPRAPRIPEGLPVVVVVLDPPAEVAANPDAFRQSGEEVTERIVFTPGTLHVLRQIRLKYYPLDNPAAPALIAPLPPSLQERCIADPTLVAEIIHNRIELHLPYYRQQGMFAALGANFDRRTLCGWAMLGVEWLRPIYLVIQDEHRRCRYRQFDETPIKYLKPGTGKAQQGYFWVSNIPDGSVLFRWHAGRDANGVAGLFGADPEPTAGLSEKQLEELVHIIQCDAYSAYGTWAASRHWVLLAGCHAHVRRKFFEAMEQAPGLVGWIIRQYVLLYRIETRLREAKAGPALRQAVRAAESRMIFERLERVIRHLALRTSILPKSKLGRAITYALNNWERLGVFLTKGRVEIDNNLVENAIRPTKLGAKNWLFIGSEEAGEPAAVLYTIVENCRRLGINVREYLVDVLTRLPAMKITEVAALTPASWLKARQTAAKQDAA